MKTTFSLVTYNNNIEALKILRDSILRVESLDKLYVINNATEDDIHNIFSYEKIEYKHQSENLGFGNGHNIGIQKAITTNSDYHVIINPDIVFDSGIIKIIIDFLVDHPDIGAVMPKIIYPDGKIQYLCKLLPTPFISFMRRFAPGKFLKNKIDYKYEMQFSGYDQIMDIPVLSGCFMFIRTKVLEEVGEFDERFFMYAEDVDLSRRIHQKYRTVFFPEVSVMHNYEKGSYKNYKLLKYHLISLFKYYCKWGWFFDKERNLVNQKALKQFDKVL